MKPLLITFLLILSISSTNLKGQVLFTKNNDLNQINHVQIKPKTSIEYTVTTDSCLFFVSDFLTFLTLPLGKTFEWKIPAGTKFQVSAGKYFLENNSSSTLEFKLTSIDKCTQQTKEINK